MTRLPPSGASPIAASTSCVVYGSAAARSMRTPRERSAAVGLGPRATTVLFASRARNFGVSPSPSVALKSARVPTPVWKMASAAGRASSERTSSPIAPASRSGTSASAGACTGTPPRAATSSASCWPSRASRIAMRLPRIRLLPPAQGLQHAADLLVQRGERFVADGDTRGEPAVQPLGHLLAGACHAVQRRHRAGIEEAEIEERHARRRLDQRDVREHRLVRSIRRHELQIHGLLCGLL